MIEELHIGGLGVIDDAVLELSPGLTVVTGETGAGKTMVVTGLGLLLGARADAGAVRSGAARALVEGRLLLTAGSPAAQVAAAATSDAGAETGDDGELLMARSVSAEGRSRAWLGGRAVPVGVLADLAGELVAVHGQADQMRLLSPARQRDALDRYAGEPLATELAAFRADHGRLAEVEAELADITTRGRERRQEADLLRFGLDEIAALAPEPDEDVRLVADSERLAHADALRTAAETAHAALLGEPDAVDAADALSLLATARRALEQVRGHDPGLAAIADRLTELAALTAEAGADLAHYADGVDADPLRLQSLQERRAALRTLTRKYGESLAEVLAWADDAASRLTRLEGDDERLAELSAERDVLRERMGRTAASMSDHRTGAAGTLGAAITAELAELAMPDAAVSVEVSSTEVNSDGDPAGLGVAGRRVRFGPHGVDDVELRLAPHAGSAPRPLARGASGGELSRVMLAVEVVLAGADPVPTFVFDEVDAGVGGRAAVEVGRRLAALARSAQVLVVTHLPQVAAFADRHLVVHKTSDGRVTRSSVTTLDDAGRVAELTRMLAGLEGSESGRAHAEELLAAATSAKQS